VIDLLADPWSDAFMRRALLEVALLGLAGGALGCWVVLNRLSYTSESLAHGLLPGLVAAALAGVPLALGGAAGLLLAAAAIALVGRIEALGRDTAVAVVVTTLLGLGGLLALAPATPAGLSALLFGDPLAVSDGDLALAAGLAVAVGAALAVLHPRLVAVGFDRASAPGLGIRALPVELALLALIALALTVAVQGLGNLLVIAVLVAPAVAARRLTRRLPAMLAASAAIAAIAGVAGLYVSYHAEVAAGAAIAGCLLLAAGLAYALPPAARAARFRSARGSTPRRAAAGGTSAR
jgi:ABC-type Mn2+/Zn2+ transport system permease subunit